MMDAFADVRPGETCFYEQLIKGFIPERVFDCHAHLYRQDLLGGGGLALAGGIVSGPKVADRAAYDNAMTAMMPGREPEGGLFFAYPSETIDMQASNDFIASEVAVHGGSRGLMMLHPNDNPADVEALVLRYRFSGFKVYYIYSGLADAFGSVPASFIPEWAWEIAQRYRLVIMLHLVMPRALAEIDNQKYIVSHCVRFPDAQLVLAHAARGFCGRHTIDSVHVLADLPNVWFDTSAICEPEPFIAILRTFGASRLLFGSDYPISSFRARPVSVGDGFWWVDESDIPEAWKLGTPILCGLQSLLAIKQACNNMALEKADVETLFWGNSVLLLRNHV